MLRRSLVVITALVLLGLCFTAGYALLHFRSAKDVLTEARMMAERGEVLKAVQLLDLTERGAGMQKAPELRRQVWSLRLQCNMRIGNQARALEDIERLIADNDPDASLPLNRIYLLAVTGQGALARQRAVEYLAAHPDSARGLELAGEACQVDYQDRLTKANEQLRTDLEYELYEPSREAMLAYLYRPNGDSSVADALLELRALYERSPARRQAWIRMQDMLKDLRDRIQQGLEYFQRSLELACVNPEERKQFYAAAFRGASFALQQGGRRDSVVAQANIYRSAFDNPFTVEAAIDAANANLDDGLWRATIATADSYLPPGKWQEVRNARNPETMQPLMVAKAIALWRMGARNELERYALELDAMYQAGFQMPRAVHLAFAFFYLIDGNNLAEAEGHTTAAFHLVIDDPVPVSGPDLVNLVVPLRLELMRKQGKPVEEITEAIQIWAARRPASTAPLRERARSQLAAGMSNAAMATASSLLVKEPRDDEALHILADAARATYADSGQDGPGLLAMCLSRNVLRPDVPHPVCYLLCGEAALAQGHLAIARECGRTASDEFTLARWPRHLQAKALIAGAGWAEAAQVLERWIATEPTDTDAVKLWFEACRKQGLPVDLHLHDVVRLGVQDPAITLALLRRAVQGGLPNAALIAQTVRQRAAKEDLDSELLALAAQALAETDAQATRELLDRALQTPLDKLLPSTATTLADASMQWLQTVAVANADDKLLEIARAELRKPHMNAAAAGSMIRAAYAMRKRSRPLTAYELVTYALSLRGAEEQRTGASFLLAGELALELRRIERARDHLTAAISFEDGSDSAEPLTKLLLALNEQGWANAAYHQLGAASSPALAMIYGTRETAFPMALAAAIDDPGSLQAQLVATLTAPAGKDLMAALDEKDRVRLGSRALSSGKDAFGAEIKAAPAPVQRMALELAAMLDEPALAKLALVRANKLLAALPDSLAAKLMQARALAGSGNGQNAAAIHAALFATGCREAVLFAEAARCSKLPDYAIAEPIRTELRKRAESNPDSLPAAELAYALRDLALEWTAAGRVEDATRAMAKLWTTDPVGSGASVQDALALADRNRLLDALTILGRLAERADGDVRKTASDALFGLAAERGVPDQIIAGLMTIRAKAQLADKGPFGPPLRFLLADPERLQGVADADVRKWLTTVVQHAAAGTESMPFALVALDQLDRRYGRTNAMQLVDQLVQQHPEAPDFWVVRARYLAQDRRAAEGIADARAALSFGAPPTLHLELLAIAGEERCVTAEDLIRIQQLPKPLLESQRGCYVRGLFALREGKTKDADALLAKAEPRLDGFHLFARGLAQLADPAPTAQQAAGQLFASFVKDYPSNPLARSAGSFARQLGVN